jgi:predicted AAA+ superfamily ATPase
MKQITRSFTVELTARLKEKGALIQAVLGPRQVGKTTGVKQCLASLRAKSLYVSADDLLATHPEWLRGHWQKALLLPAGSILVIDEIQKVNRWQEALKDLWDNHNSTRIRVVILGSSSFEIQQGLTESLAGRYEILRVRHWSAAESEKLGVAFDQYLIQGGYPGSYRLLKNAPRWQAYMRDAILENVLNKDIFRLRPLSKPVLFRQFLEIIRAYPCQEISYNKMLGQLQDKGNVELVKNYLFLLECAFLYKGLEKYSRKEHLKKGSSPKILPLCPALCTYEGSLKTWRDPDKRGRLFEVLVGSILQQLPGRLYYWRERNEEVDFVYEGERTFAIEVKSGKKRKVGGLTAFVAQYPDAVAVFIDSKNYSNFEENPEVFLELMAGGGREKEKLNTES